MPYLNATCDLLYSLGVTANYKGFLHTTYAVSLCMERQDRRDNPKFCVIAKSGANREKFIMGGRRVKRLPPC